MTLRQMVLEESYRSDRDNIGQDFLAPCLKQATYYWRAVGYFTSDALAAVSSGLGPFAERGGKIRLIASPRLSEGDVKAISEGYIQRDEIIAGALERTLREPMPDPVRERLGCLAWLVAKGLLDIKIALFESNNTIGMYHEKIGILLDDDDNRVVFTGSSNESGGGLVMNFESIDVFRSWEPGEASRVRRKISDFESLWNNQTASLKVISFPEAARKALLELQPRGTPKFPSASAETTPSSPPRDSSLPEIPDGLEIRSYQRDAINAWIRANGRGVLRMATGTGKTITALTLVNDLATWRHKNNSPLFVLVLCPYQNLVDQWAESAERFGVDPVKCYKSYSYWGELLGSKINAVLGGRPFGMAIATYDTLQTAAFQEQIGDLEGVLLVIADEMHNAGAPATRQSLPARARFRLGLSATPERWYDDEGTEALFGYFGPPVFELGLREAIAIGALTPYRYFPILVELIDEELGDYLQLTERIGKLVGDEDVDRTGNLDPRLQMLLLKRARIIANATGKVPALREVMFPFRATSHNLIYCGDGSEAGSDPTRDTEDQRQISAVTRVLGQQLEMKAAKYISNTPLEIRRSIVEEFIEGRMQAIVAIRCLDEGVDIPEIRRAFILASSTNPRQFIQRRGRILRRSPGKVRAELYDFLAVPPADRLSIDQIGVERRLVRRELARVVEFASIAENGPQAMQSLLELRKRYELLDIGIAGGTAG